MNINTKTEILDAINASAERVEKLIKESDGPIFCMIVEIYFLLSLALRVYLRDK